MPLGEGSFFKAHVDTPRSTRMFGSLVVFLPTSYEGGTLVMRKNGEEWSFDAAKALAKCESPHIAYVALYSDVEHEVSMVTSGHRVTVTYNLYFDDDSPLVPSSSLSPNAITLKNELEALLLDATFLPNGGCLGFDLQHCYPVEASTSSYVCLGGIEGRLKGSDAEIVQVATELSLYVSIRGLVSYQALYAFEDEIPDFTEKRYDDDYSIENYLREAGGVIVEKKHDGDECNRDLCVNWITKSSKLNEDDKMFVYFGNSAEAGYTYSSFCLFVEVGKPGERAKRPELQPPDEEEPQDKHYYSRENEGETSD